MGFNLGSINFSSIKAQAESKLNELSGQAKGIMNKATSVKDSIGDLEGKAEAIMEKAGVDNIESFLPEIDSLTDGAMNSFTESTDIDLDSYGIDGNAILENVMGSLGGGDD